MTVARKAYEEFAKQRHRIAIEASVKVIAAAARAAAAAKNPATFVCPVAKKQDGALQMCERAPEWRKDQKCAPVTDTAPVAQRGAPSSSVAPSKPIEGAKPWEIRR